VASISSLVQSLHIGPEPTQVKHLLVAPLWRRVMASPINIRLGWKGLPGTHPQAYYKQS